MTAMRLFAYIVIFFACSEKLCSAAYYRNANEDSLSFVAVFCKKHRPEKNYAVFVGYRMWCVMKKGPGVNGDFIGVRNDSLLLMIVADSGKKLAKIFPADAERIVSERPEEYDSVFTRKLLDKYAGMYNHVNYSHVYINNWSIWEDYHSDHSHGDDSCNGCFSVILLPFYVFFDDVSRVKTFDMYKWQLAKKDVTVK